MPALAAVAFAGAPQDELRDIQPPVALEAAPRWPLYAGAAGALTAVSGGVILLVVRRRRCRAPEPAPAAAPHEVALAELEALERTGGQDARHFCERLSTILRDYIEGRYGLRAPEAPTGELLARLFGMCHFEAPRQGALRDLFRDCDLVKYAGRRPSPAELGEIVVRCRDWVAATRLEIPASPAAVLFR